eukprot:863956_1
MAKSQQQSITLTDVTSDLRDSYKTDAHQLSHEEITKRYGTDLVKGLTLEQHESALAKHGFNILKSAPKGKWWIKLLVSVFGGFFNIMLWTGCILSFVSYFVMKAQDPKHASFDEIYIAGVLCLVVVSTGIFTYFQDMRSAAVMDSFQNMLPAEILAVRNGHHVARPASSLVPGDLLELKSGDKIPADVRVIRCSKGCSADHSSLTGESDAQQRSPEADVGEPEPMEAKSLLFFGTLLVRGHCTGVVIATGDHTLMGRIARLADETEMHETPIAIELDNFVKKISILAVVIALIFGSLSFMKASGSTSFVSNFAKAVVFFIGILVANVPEGLLATVTVSLTLTAKLMSKKEISGTHAAILAIYQAEGFETESSEDDTTQQLLRRAVWRKSYPNVACVVRYRRFFRQRSDCLLLGMLHDFLIGYAHA